MRSKAQNDSSSLSNRRNLTERNLGYFFCGNINLACGAAVAESVDIAKAVPKSDPRHYIYDLEHHCFAGYGMEKSAVT